MAKDTVKQYFLYTEDLGLKILGVPTWGIRAKCVINFTLFTSIH